MACVKFPGVCENLIPDLIEENLKKVAESVIGGGAFQNPLEGKLSKINDLLSGISGLNQNAPNGDLQDAIDSIENNLVNFKNHTDQLAGIGGSIDEFGRRLSIANIENRIKQQLGDLGDSFERMFSSFGCDVDKILNNTITQLGLAASILGADGTIDEVVELARQAENIFGQVATNIAGDVESLLNAEALLSRFNIANLIVSNNCFFETLIKDGIGTDELLKNFQGALDFRNAFDLNFDLDLNKLETVKFVRTKFEIPDEVEDRFDTPVSSSDIIPGSQTPVTPEIIAQSQKNSVYANRLKKEDYDTHIQVKESNNGDLIRTQVISEMTKTYNEVYKPYWNEWSSWANSIQFGDPDAPEARLIDPDTGEDLGADERAPDIFRHYDNYPVGDPYNIAKTVALENFLYNQRVELREVSKLSDRPNDEFAIWKRMVAAQWIWLSGPLKFFLETPNGNILYVPSVFVSNDLWNTFPHTDNEKAVQAKVFRKLDTVWRTFEFAEAGFMDILVEMNRRVNKIINAGYTLSTTQLRVRAGMTPEDLKLLLFMTAATGRSIDPRIQSYADKTFKTPIKSDPVVKTIEELGALRGD